jgi:hypothetical protein
MDNNTYKDFLNKAHSECANFYKYTSLSPTPTDNPLKIEQFNSCVANVLKAMEIEMLKRISDAPGIRTTYRWS